MEKEKLGAFIKTLRQEQGLTQRELAGKLHLTDTAISKWERGLSFPDITLLPNLAEALEISIYELMCGERKTEEQTPRQEANAVLTEAVEASRRKERTQRKKFVIITIGLSLVFLLMVLFGRKLVNLALDAWSAKADVPYHSSSFTVRYPQMEETQGYYIYRTAGTQEHHYLYHVMSVDAEGEEREAFCLEEYGMALDRAPKLKVEADCLYILFDGLDNEDTSERIYNEKVGADPQAFLPTLYCYRFEQGAVEQIPVKNSSTSLLLDAFSYSGETVYLTGRFKGLLGGLNLGFYLPKGSGLYRTGNKNAWQGEDEATLVSGSQSTLVAESKTALVGEGGMQTKGCLDGTTYYVCGQDGIYGYVLESGKMEQVLAWDFSRCVRAEIKKMSIGEMEYFALVAAEATETDTFHNVTACRTKVMLLDKEMKVLRSMELETGVSALEWGRDSAVISCVQKEGLSMVYVDFAEFSSIELTDLLDVELQEKLIKQCREASRLDEMEQCRNQWVYLEGQDKYVLTGTKVVIETW